MALEWKNKIDGVDDVLADDVNALAAEIIKNAEELAALKEKDETFATELANKVDAQDGKQLSTEDYTSGEKEHLSYLSAYFMQIPEDVSLDDLTEPGNYIGYDNDDNYNGMQYTSPFMIFVGMHNYYNAEQSLEYPIVCQTRIYCDAIDGNAEYIIQRRTRNNSVWSAWKSVYATKSYIDSAIQTAILDSWEVSV